jgi:hypothetical protein
MEVKELSQQRKHRIERSLSDIFCHKLAVKASSCCFIWSQIIWACFLALPHTSCVTQAEWSFLLHLDFIICKMGIIVTFSQHCYENEIINAKCLTLCLAHNAE